MSYCPATLEACPTLQDQIYNYFDTCGSSLHMESIPMAEFIASGANRSNLTQVISPGNGKVRTIDLLYEQMILESAVTAGETEFCTATTKRGNCSHQYTIDTTDNLTIEQKIDSDDLTDVCINNGEWLSRQITRMMIALEHRIASKWATQVVALAGDWNTADIPETVDGGGNLVIPVSTDLGALSPVASQILSNDLSLNGFCGPTFVAGGTVLYRYMAASMAAGCCTDQGLDIGAMTSKWGMAVAYDRRIKNSMGGDAFALAVMQGAVVPLTWTKNQWRDGVAVPTGGSNYVNYGLLTPRLSIPVDVYFVDNCPGVFHITISAVTNLVGLPADLYPTGYILDGWKGVAKIKATTCVDPCA